jgi:hypothetical protein
MREANEYADRMQQPGGDDEAEAVEQCTRALGQFAAVRVAVEDREESDDDGGELQRWPDFCQNHRARHHRRQRNAGFDPGQRETEQAHLTRGRPFEARQRREAAGSVMVARRLLVLLLTADLSEHYDRLPGGSLELAEPVRRG